MGIGIRVDVAIQTISFQRLCIVGNLPTRSALLNVNSSKGRNEKITNLGFHWQVPNTYAA